MDGPFFSVMPFGKTGFHSLTSVSHTPHDTCYESLPKFDCQKKSSTCSEWQLDNCNQCKYVPESKIDDVLFFCCFFNKMNKTTNIINTSFICMYQ